MVPPRAVSSSSSSGVQFPLYLLPPIPFLRRAKPDAVADQLKAPVKKRRSKKCKAVEESDAAQDRLLTGHTQYLRCRNCQSDLCFTESIISKGFMGRHGRAYLLSELSTPRITLSKPIPRPLVTGMHTVSDISCSLCDTTLGWKYINAEEVDQRYKIGKYILERERVVKINYWDGPEEIKDMVECGDDSEIEVDIGDEDELEDLFLGVWTKEGASRRRKRKEERKGKES